MKDRQPVEEQQEINTTTAVRESRPWLVTAIAVGGDCCCGRRGSMCVYRLPCDDTIASFTNTFSRNDK